MKKEILIKDITRNICNKSLAIHRSHSSIYEKLDYNQKWKFKLYQVMQKYISNLVFWNAYCDLKFWERIEKQLNYLEISELNKIFFKLNTLWKQSI